MPGHYAHDQFCDLAQAEVDSFAQTVLRAQDLRLPVPSCPKWRLRELVEHLGQIHRWVARLVRDRSARSNWRWISDAQLPPDPVGTAACADWILAGGQALLAELLLADPADPMWAWGMDQHVRFWSRRMLHETAIHRIDAQLSIGVRPLVSADLAVDGVEEFLEVLPGATWRWQHLRRLRGDGERICLVALDKPRSWTITLGPDRFSWAAHSSAGPAEVSVRGTASDLYLLLWGRLDRSDSRIEISGDQPILDRWCAHALI